MAQVTLPYTLTAGTPENVNNLMSNLNALKDGVNTIDTAQIAANAVTSAKIASSAVGSSQLATDAVTNAKIATDAVDSDEIKAGAVGTSELAAAVGNFGAWTDYTPALTAVTTNPTLGTSSTAAGRYCQIGKSVFVFARILFGSASAAAGSGVYSVSMPVTAANMATNQTIGRARLTDSSAAALGTCDVQYGTTTTVTMIYQASWPTGAPTSVAHDTPWTWANSDAIRLWFLYEAA